MRRGYKPKKIQKSRWRKAVIAAASSSLLSLNVAGVFLMQTSPFQTEPFVPPPTPQEYLAQNCHEPSCDLLLLQTIIFCESSWRMVKNSSSSAYGFFQIIDGTERTTPQYALGRRKFDPYTNIDMGLHLYEKRGSSPWNESKGCWQPRYWQAKARDTAME
ncbi:MAG: transglycosylase SLT domain-containing protein [Patescibacteria group bacterium]